MADDRGNVDTYIVRVLAHDGQVIVNDLLIRGAKRQIEFAVPPSLAQLLHGEDDAIVEVRKALAVYEQTADDGTRIYRIKVDL